MPPPLLTRVRHILHNCTVHGALAGGGKKRKKENPTSVAKKSIQKRRRENVNSGEKEEEEEEGTSGGATRCEFLPIRENNIELKALLSFLFHFRSPPLFCLAIGRWGSEGVPIPKRETGRKIFVPKRFPPRLLVLAPDVKGEG